MAGYLGRFQAGQFVPISIATVNSSSVPTSPDAAPIAVVTDPNSDQVASIVLAMQGGSLQFGVSYFVGLTLILGTYQIGYSYSVAGVPETATGSFDVIEGGDAGGAVISMYAYGRPEAQYVLAQLASGMLIMGKNPKI